MQIINYILNVSSLLLAQTEKQKTQTILSVMILALVVSLFIMDIFAKNTFAGKTALKKIIFGFAIVVAIVLVVLLIFYK